MMFRQLLPLLAVAVTFLLIAGCNGPAPALDQSISMTVNGVAQPPTNIPCGTSLALAATVTSNSTSSASNNPVTSTTWTQSASNNPGQFLVSSSNSLSNTWVAPESLRSGAAQETVTITLSVKTLLGGTGSTTINLLVTPQSSLPIYNFTDALGNPLVTMNPPNTTPLFAGQLDEATFAKLGINGTVTYNGTTYTKATISQLPNVTFTWSDAVAGTNYNFDHPDQMQPIWTAPALSIGTEPNGTALYYIPQTSYLKVITTVNGNSSTSYLVVPVIDSLVPQ